VCGTSGFINLCYILWNKRLLGRKKWRKNVRHVCVVAEKEKKIGEFSKKKSVSVYFKLGTHE